MLNFNAYWHLRRYPSWKCDSVVRKVDIGDVILGIISIKITETMKRDEIK